ncbi:uncharacterized protein MYCGRDRAFT_95527 [Zymoseptoria tritici IPO323]|uniref:Uncharacterized protein n=1 Tax=Zymoseptoria tritici (strain CBS 115943 / IPO323) TaxID=336722 RepID=F9XIZ5_ZYMTI|nr:uncharacterized protein MYCGRDRAFT_95527 [Zymoseptoria tritici IPO323]EGP84262.1 hypothetical protein MYCGRDRAFT_95527 [Zymoseptoria tritici IPO323]
MANLSSSTRVLLFTGRRRFARCADSSLRFPVQGSLSAQRRRNSTGNDGFNAPKGFKPRTATSTEPTASTASRLFRSEASRKGLDSKPDEPAPKGRPSIDTCGQYFNSEEYYRYYLRPSKPYHGFEAPGHWLTKIDVNTIREELPVALQERPLDFFSSPSRDMTMARRCLEVWSTNVECSRQGIREKISSARAGSAAEAWLMEDFDSADLSADLGVGFLRPLVHCLVAEEKQCNIWAWLRSPRSPRVLSSQSAYERAVWRTAVLRFLVESEAYWDPGGINQSLRAFDKVWSLETTSGPSLVRGDMTFGKSMAGLWIFKQLLFNGANRATDVELYDNFVSTMPRWNKLHFGYEFNRVRLLQVHPSKPDILLSLDFLRQCLDAIPRPDHVREFFKKWVAYGFLCDTARALERAGLKAEARWVLDIGRAEMPKHFTHSPRLNAHTDRTPMVRIHEGLTSQRRQVVDSERGKRRQEYFDYRAQQ